MKHFITGIVIALALVTAIVMGVVALAETAEPETALPPAVGEAPAATQPDEGASAATDDSAALQDALNAYNAARQSGRIEDLETELNGYVAAGKLTQAQADLILNYYKEQEALRNGVCPNCGYQFQNNGGFGKGGRMNGGKGSRGGRGGRGGQGMRGYGQQSIDGQQPNPDQGDAQTNGASWEGEWQVMPNVYDFDTI